MTWHRLLPLLTVLALIVAPFGRMAAAEAMPPSRHAAMSAPGHCDDMPSPDRDKSDRALDCLTACAALAAIASDGVLLVAPAALAVECLPAVDAAGLNPEAEPPPPRFS